VKEEEAEHFRSFTRVAAAAAVPLIASNVHWQPFEATATFAARLLPNAQCLSLRGHLQYGKRIADQTRHSTLRHVQHVAAAAVVVAVVVVATT